MGSESGPPRLIADAMVGALARWLRVLGFDVVYDAGLDDPEIVARAAADGRIILTRDRRLVERRGARDRSLLIESDAVEEQILQAVRELGLELDAGRRFGRCLRCNEPLVEMPVAEAAQRVPPYVARTQRRFARCPACGRVYWRATHVRRMLARLTALGLDHGAVETSHR